jgi:sugar O-acyltransferase (sialic acid O-acetyltransferase NeuD family)
MLIIGAKGHAIEILDIIEDYEETELTLYDDINNYESAKLYSKYNIITNLNEAELYFEKDNRYILGVGGTFLRKKLSDKFNAIGGVLTSAISITSRIGKHHTILGDGINVMHNVLISNNVNIGNGALINASTNIHHDVRIGEFAEIGPRAVILGNSSVGKFSFIGSNATILPSVKIGNNVVIGAGSVVTKDIPDNSLAVGIPAKIIKPLPPLEA